MFLYWVCPDKYLPLDATTRIFLEKNGVRIFKEKDLDWAHYSELQKKVEVLEKIYILEFVENMVETQLQLTSVIE